MHVQRWEWIFWTSKIENCHVWRAANETRNVFWLNSTTHFRTATRNIDMSLRKTRKCIFYEPQHQFGIFVKKECATFNDSTPWTMRSSRYRSPLHTSWQPTHYLTNNFFFYFSIVFLSPQLNYDFTCLRANWSCNSVNSISVKSVEQKKTIETEKSRKISTTVFNEKTVHWNKTPKFEFQINKSGVWKKEKTWKHMNTSTLNRLRKMPITHRSSIIIAKTREKRKETLFEKGARERRGGYVDKSRVFITREFAPVWFETFAPRKNCGCARTASLAILRRNFHWRQVFFSFSPTYLPRNPRFTREISKWGGGGKRPRVGPTNDRSARKNRPPRPCRRL